MKCLLIACFLLFASQQAASQDTVRVMTYNLLQYYPSSNYTRDQYFRTVVRSVDPDILVVQEIDTAEAVQNFLVNVLDAVAPGAYLPGVFVDGFDSENAIFYKTEEFEFVENMPIKTALRDINQFTVRHLASDRLIMIYSLHLKASAVESVKRGMEVDSLRKVTNALPAGTDFMVLGDFNIYGSDESAYQKLIEVDAGNEGHFIDPQTMTGIWNDTAYAQFHTQSPRTRSFGYGATGGLDDRFDMILISKAAIEPGGIVFIPNSYRAFGNDGQHYNDSINRRPNAAVADSIADALHAASDHLPVIAEFALDPAVEVERNSVPDENFLFPNYPNPFNPTTAFSFRLSAFNNVRLSVFDMLGREVAVLVNEKKAAGNYTVTWDASGFPSGVYLCRLTAGAYVETRGVLLMK
jgi:endonuclease/exonuclease/phosphatase family metal-dependent hydrolase